MSIFFRPRSLSVLILTTLAGAALAGADVALAQAVSGSMAPHGIIPAPVSVELSADESFVVTAETPIVVERGNPEALRVGRFLASLIGTSAESTPPVVETDGTVPAAGILLTTEGAPADLGAEGYSLSITSDGITLLAAEPAGLFYGVQTLRLLLPAAVEYTAAFPRPLPVPTGSVVDRPRYEWRGAMLDVSRHFFTVDEVKRYVDLLALYKLNRLHLHLSDDQGWRIEIEGWPNLTAHGGSTEVGGGPGGFYTQAEYADLVQYAADRFVTVVPEIDVPGHINAALASYPELTCDGVAPPLYTGTSVGFSSLCVEKEVVYTFLDDVVRQLAALTPGPYLHLGGDEVRELSPEQYAGFMARAQAIVASHGKRFVGWDEVAEVDLLPESVVQTWRPQRADVAASVAEAVAAGARVVLSPSDRIYLDIKYDSTTVLGLTWPGLNSVRDAYEWDPGTLLPDVPTTALLGVEAPLWAETLGTFSDVEFMAFPRLAGVAELGWSPAAALDWEGYRLRLGAQAPRWTALGVTFYRSPDVPWQEGGP